MDLLPIQDNQPGENAVNSTTTITGSYNPNTDGEREEETK